MSLRLEIGIPVTLRQGTFRILCRFASNGFLWELIQPNLVNTLRVTLSRAKLWIFTQIWLIRILSQDLDSNLKSAISANIDADSKAHSPAMVNDSGEKQEELDWIKRFQQGETRIFDEVMARYKNRIYGLCYRYLGIREDAAEAAQDVFVKAYFALKEFRGECKLFTWLCRIAVNGCINRSQSKEFRQRKEILGFLDEGPAMETSAALAQTRMPAGEIEEEGNPEADLQRKRDLIRLHQALKRLPEDQRLAIVLRDIQGLAYEEVAETMKQNLGTIKSRLARGREALRKLLLTDEGL